MDDDGEKADKEAKKAEKKTEEEDDDTEDAQEEENSGESSESEEEPAHARCLPPPASLLSTEESETEVALVQNVEDLYEEKRRKTMKLKWLAVTGRKPLSIPVTKRYHAIDVAEVKQITFLGDRRPAEIERKRKATWLRMRRTYETEVTFRNQGRILHEIRYPDRNKGLCCLRFSPVADNVVTSFGNGLVQVRNPETLEILTELKSMEADKKLPVSALRYHPFRQDRVYAGGGAGLIYVFDVNTAECTATVSQADNEIMNLDVSADGALLATGGRDGHVYIYDAETLELISWYRRPVMDETTKSDIEDLFHKMRIFAVKFHPTAPNMFVSGGWDDTVKVWDTRVCGGALLSIRGPHVCGDGIDVRENEILTASWTADNSIKLWDLSSGELMSIVSPVNRPTTTEGGFLYTGQFFKGGSVLGMSAGDLIAVGGSGSGKVEIISMRKKMVTASFPSLKAVTALDSHDNLIAYGGMETILRTGELFKPPTIKKGKILRE